jgi:hypothetical protein
VTTKFEGKCNAWITSYEVQFFLEYVPRNPDTAGGWVTLNYGVCTATYGFRPVGDCHDIRGPKDEGIHLSMTFARSCVKKHIGAVPERRLWQTRYIVTATNNEGVSNTSQLEQLVTLPCVPKKVPGVDPSRR